MTAIIVTGIICLTIVILTLINRYWTNRIENSYIDEVDHEEKIYNSREQLTDRIIVYKRTYKNGTITYIDKRISA